MQDGVGYYFKIISDKIKINADAKLKRHDLTLTQYRVLSFLRSKGGRAGQKEIEVFLRVSHPTVAGLISRMERKGFVTVRHDPADRRTNIVKLTDKAMPVAQELDNDVRAQEEKLLRSLTEKQVAELHEMLLVICKNLD